MTTTGVARLTLTASHVVFTVSPTGALVSLYAGDLVPGDRLAQWTEEGLQGREVVAVQERREHSYWAPLTMEGTLLVDGFLASCYASYPHLASQVAFTPVKMLPSLLLDDEVSQHQDGVRGVVRMIKELGNMVGVRRKGKAGLEETQERMDVPWMVGGREGIHGTHGEL